MDHPLCLRVCTSLPLVVLFVVHCMIFVSGQDLPNQMHVFGAGNGTDFSQVFYPGIYSISWKLSSDAKTVALTLRGTGPKWLGIAWNSMFGMVGSEAVIGWADPVTGASVEAYNLNGEDPSLVNPSMVLSVSNTSAELVDGVLTVKFTRLIAQGRFPLTTPTLTIGAWGDVSQLQEHPEIPTEANSAIINYLSGEVASVPTIFGLREAHVLLELLAWNVLIPIGIFFARYGRKLPDSLWFNIHQIIQPTAFGIGVIGFIIAFVMTAPGQHFTAVGHSEIGTIIIILALGQVLYGFLRPHKEETGNISTARKWFERIHPCLGIFIVVLVVIQTFLGLWQAAYPNFAYFVYLAYLIVLLVLIGFLEWMKRKGM